MSIGNKRLEIGDYSSPFGDNSEGNIIIDSGTASMLFPEDFYARLEAAVVEQIDLVRVDDPNQMLSLCYQSASGDIGHLGVVSATPLAQWPPQIFIIIFFSFFFLKKYFFNFFK
jgi:hypothetical protein